MRRITSLFAPFLLIGLLMLPHSAKANAVTLSASICTDSPAVSLDSPTDGTETNSSLVTVSGQATPGYNFTVLRDTDAVASATVGSDGGYAVSAPLVVGSNAIRLHVSLPGCAATADSPTITVTRLAPPAVPEPQPSSRTETETSSSPTPSNSTVEPTTAIPPLVHPIATPLAGQRITATASGMRSGGHTVSSEVLIAGIAYPGARVNILQDGLSIGWVTADEDGHFLMRVTLHYGKNIISIVAPPLKTVTLLLWRDRDYAAEEWGAAAAAALMIAAFGAHVLLHHRNNPHHPAYVKLRWPPHTPPPTP